MTERIVVGIDGSDGARAALRWAAEEAQRRGAHLEVVRAWSFVDQPEPFDPQFGEDDVRTAVAKDLVACGIDEQDVTVRTPCALAAGALLEAAVGASLLVVGARGLGGFAGLLLGSVSQQVVHHAPCPVLVVRGE